jgi:hypothetical protein
MLSMTIAEKKREQMNKDLDVRPHGVDAQTWESFKIRRVLEREEILRDEKGAA